MKNKDFTQREQKVLVEGLMKRAGLGSYARKFVNKRASLIKEGYDPLEDDDEEDDLDLDSDGPVDGGAPDATDSPDALPDPAGGDEADLSTDMDMPVDSGLGMEAGTPPAQVSPEQVAKAVVDALKTLGLVSYEDEGAADLGAGAEPGLGGDLGGDDLDLDSDVGGGEEDVDLNLDMEDDGMGDEEEDEELDVQKLAESILKAARKRK